LEFAKGGLKAAFKAISEKTAKPWALEPFVQSDFREERTI
jgi:hypothetical protein